ncbi:MAG: DUF1192 domain-containing protein [Rhodospirillum sp.]|nr:DUF1192 domain-containing protein [Rhodospirillum sp.]MCF8491948.1 DUF1192 domain-containing protein [Rhodospirillum sp.]MCF8501096.1 DUF1192 domain-containing protein [Rhodospirillum sp.]
MDTDDLEPRPPNGSPQGPPRVLDDLSVADLEAYIIALEGEIVRVRAKIQDKGGAKATAASFFKR